MDRLYCNLPIPEYCWNLGYLAGPYALVLGGFSAFHYGLRLGPILLARIQRPMMYLKIGLILTFAGYAALEGIREAYLYHAINTSQNPNGVNLHPLFAAQRLLFGALVLFISWDIIFCLSLALLFSAIHNGFYYHSRHKLNPAIYPKGWADESTTSTAFFEFSFLERVVLAEIGIVILALDFVFIN